jgi:hypothetical protein
MTMRRIIIAVALLAAHAAHAELPFPDIDSRPMCEEQAQKAPKALQGILGGVVDPEKVKETARAGCRKAEEAMRDQARATWDKAPDALRRKCKGKVSYAALALCLMQGKR